MTRGEIWKDFLKHTVLTLVIALFLFLIFKSVFTKNGETEYFLCLALLRDSLWDSEDVCLAGSPWI